MVKLVLSAQLGKVSCLEPLSHLQQWGKNLMPGLFHFKAPALYNLDAAVSKTQTALETLDLPKN